MIKCSCLLQMRVFKRIFEKLHRKSGLGTGDIDPLKAEIWCVLSANKDLQPKTIGSSTSGIKDRGKYISFSLN